MTTEELHRLHVQASAFLNIRPPEISDNKMIFPSKILNYLSYGKPTVSSWTPGLSPEYREFLLVPKDHTAEGFAQKIDEVLNWTAEERVAYKEKLAKWFPSTHTWDVQAQRLIDWLQHSILTNNK